MNAGRLSDIRKAKGYHILPIKSGMQLELHETVGEEGNIRTWRFKGLVIKVKKPNQVDGTFTIRGKSAGHTIEKIYPLSFQKFEKVLLMDSYKIRRAKLYYLRDKVGKDARLNSLLRNDEKGVDLLTLATDEAKELQAAYEAEHKDEEATPEEAGDVEKVATQETSTEEVTAEAPKEETTEVAQEEKQEEQAEAASEEQAEEAQEEEQKEE